jgi:tRNA(fMet)-specific endonuclease VapC
VVERFKRTPVGQVGMSVVTYAELRHGVERCPASDRAAAEHALRRFVALVPVLPFEERAAESYGVIAAAVRDRRRDALDRFIAAHAVSVGATLVTNNEADFKDYPGLAVENWVNPPGQH